MPIHESTSVLLESVMAFQHLSVVRHNEFSLKHSTSSYDTQRHTSTLKTGRALT